MQITNFDAKYLTPLLEKLNRKEKINKDIFVFNGKIQYQFTKNGQSK